jgi:hypothetical protein
MVKSDNATVNLIKLLAPGFLALFIIGVIVDIGSTREFDLIFFGFALTLICWGLAYPLLWAFVRVTGATVVWDLSNPIFATYVLILAIVVGVFGAVSVQLDLFYAVLRKLPGAELVNKRSAKRPLPFLLQQNTTGNLRRDGDSRPQGKVTEAWLIVRVKQGGAYAGWPEFYGVGKDASEIYLSPACEVEITANREERTTKHKGPGVLIYEREITAVEFMDRSESACFLLWFPSKSQ